MSIATSNLFFFAIQYYTRKHIHIIIIIIIIIIIKIVHEVQKDRIRQKKGQNNQHVHK